MVPVSHLPPLPYNSWEPVDADSGELYSTSVLDVFRALFDILDFWEKLDWPDAEAAEEFLFAYLADSVCACVGFYGDALLETVFPQPTLPEEFGAGGQFYYCKTRLQSLNNLEEALVKFADVYEYMRVDDVAASHQRRAQAANQNHSGRILPHKALRYFAEAEQRLRATMTCLVDTAAERVCDRVVSDVSAIAHAFSHHADDAAEFVETSLSYMLDQTEEDDAAQKTAGTPNAKGQSKDTLTAIVVPTGDTGAKTGGGVFSALGLKRGPGNKIDTSGADDTASVTSIATQNSAQTSVPDSASTRTRTRSFHHQKPNKRRAKKSALAGQVKLVRDGYLNTNLAVVTLGLQYEATMDLVISAVFREVMRTLRDVVLGKIPSPLSTVRWFEQSVVMASLVICILFIVLK